MENEPYQSWWGKCVGGGLESYISVSASMSGSQHKARLAAALRGDQGENPFTLEQSGCIDVREVKKKKKTQMGGLGLPKWKKTPESEQQQSYIPLSATDNLAHLTKNKQNPKLCNLCRSISAALLLHLVFIFLIVIIMWALLGKHAGHSAVTCWFSGPPEPMIALHVCNRRHFHSCISSVRSRSLIAESVKGALSWSNTADTDCSETEQKKSLHVKTGIHHSIYYNTFLLIHCCYCLALTLTLSTETSTLTVYYKTELVGMFSALVVVFLSNRFWPQSDLTMDRLTILVPIPVGCCSMSAGASACVKTSLMVWSISPFYQVEGTSSLKAGMNAHLFLRGRPGPPVKLVAGACVNNTP